MQVLHVFSLCYLSYNKEQRQNYCVELLSTSIKVQYSMMLLACAGAAETLPADGPHIETYSLGQLEGL